MKIKYTYCCKICNKEFISGQSFTAHLKNEHPDYTKEQYYLKFIATDINCNKCKTCGSITKFLGYSKGFAEYCSSICQRRNIELNKKRKDTARSHFNGKIRSDAGTEHIKQANSLNAKSRIQKARETYYKKTGYDWPSKNPEVRKKVKESCLFKYGVEYISQSDEIKEKIKQTCLKKYGVENAAQSDIVKENYKNNCIKKYGVDSTNKLDIVKEKKKETCLTRYGKNNYFQTEEFKEKFIKTNNEKYGYNYHTQRPEYQEYYEQLCKEKYGINRYCQTEEFKIKSKQTCLEKYGNETFAGSIYAVNARKSKYRYNNIYFDSSWELKYYIWLKDHNIEFEYHPNISFEYEYNNSKHKYYPDFKVNSELQEIKGEQFFDKNNNPINPYNSKNSEKIIAKYKCMLKNNIKILRKKELIKILKEVTQKYGKDYFKQYKC